MIFLLSKIQPFLHVSSFFFVGCRQRRGRQGLPQLRGCVVTLPRSPWASCLPSQTFFGTAEDRFYFKASATKDVAQWGNIRWRLSSQLNGILLHHHIPGFWDVYRPDIDNGKRQVDNDSYLEIDFFLEIIRALLFKLFLSF